MNYKKIVITGSTGLVGRAISNYLIENGYETIGLNRGKCEFTSNNLSIDLAETSLNDQIDWSEVSVIVHCAAMIPSQSNTFEKCSTVNQKMDRNIFDILKSHSHLSLIFISTTNFYIFNNEIITEESPIQLMNEYAKAKLESEKLFLSLGNSVKILRINSPYHGTMKTNTVLKIFIDRALHNEDLVYHGEGSRMQDFVHVDDIARAVKKCFDKPLINGIFNIASGDPISMKNLAKLVVTSISNCKSNILASGKEENQENYRAYFDLSKSKMNLDWQPIYTIERGVKEWLIGLK